MEIKARVLIKCQDSKGLVYRISKVFYDMDLNIDNNREFVDKDKDKFFMRTVATGRFDVENLRANLQEILPKDAELKNHTTQPQKDSNPSHQRVSCYR